MIKADKQTVLFYCRPPNKETLSRQTERQTEIVAERHNIGGQTDREKTEQADRQTDRQTDTQRSNRHNQTGEKETGS